MSHGGQALETSFASQPLSFEPNRGQTNPQVKFFSRGPGYTFFLTETASAVLSLGGTSPVEHPAATMKAGENQEQQKEPTEPAPSTGAAIRMELAGANPAPTMEGINE